VRNRLMLFPGVEVTLVPWLLDSTRSLYARPERPLPGQSRRGEPAAPSRRRSRRKQKNGAPIVRKNGTTPNTRSTDSPAPPTSKR
jgi:hypothetical protein